MTMDKVKVQGQNP